MFSTWKFILTIFGLSTCNIKESAHWSCSECLVCHQFSPASRALLIDSYEKEFIDFADDYLHNIKNPRHPNPRAMKRATNKFLRVIYRIQTDLTQSNIPIPIQEQQFIIQTLKKTWLKLDTLAVISTKNDIDGELFTEYQGVHKTLKRALRGLFGNKTSKIRYK